MNILILGSGGRENALTWVVQQNPKCDRLWMVPGREAPPALGVSDALRAADILTFGPSKAAAALKSSKNFTKQICECRQSFNRSLWAF